MKTNIFISIVALILSAIALVSSLQSQKSIDEEQMQNVADEAIRKREKEFIEEFKPKFQRMLSGMRDIDKDWEPETLEELFKPLTRLMEEMPSEVDQESEQDGAGQPATAPQSKSKGIKNTKQESKERSQ